jgi:hypothetical protein
VNPRRPVLITPGRHPFEVVPLAACALAGSYMAVSGVRPPSMTAAMPEPVLTAWLALVAVGGALGLLGVYWRGDVADGLLIEFAGVSAVALACTLYVAVLFVGNPVGVAFGAAGLLAGLAGGAGWRAGQCLTDWRRVHRGAVTAVRIELPLVTEERPPDVDDDEQGPAA